MQVLKTDMQNDKYKYTWSGDEDVGPARGMSDRVKIDRDHGAEVRDFIQAIVNRFNIKDQGMIPKIEDAVHAADDSHVVSRHELEQDVIDRLNLS